MHLISKKNAFKAFTSQLTKPKSLFLLTSFSFIVLNNNSNAQENTLPSNGNVGIGTTNPTSKLDVKGSVKIDSTLNVKDSIIVNKDARIKKNLTVEKDVKFAGLETVNNIGNKNFLVIKPNGKLEQFDKAGLTNLVALSIYEEKTCPAGDIANPTWSNGVNKIYNNCPQVNFGLGTSTPAYKLHVAGTTYSSDYKGADAYLNNRMVVGSLDVNSSDFGKLLIKNTSNGASLMFDQAGNNNDYTKLIFAEIQNPTTEIIKVFNTQANYTPFLLSSSGAMEIHNGTRRIFQLDSEGYLRVRKLRIDQNDWADYVFEPNYELMPLSDVKKYVVENKHLPDVPSEKEVKSNGVDISEMNVIYLKKMEELFLYNFQLQQELDELKQEIVELKEMLYK